MHAYIQTDRQTYRHIDIQTYRHTHVYISILVQHRPLSLPSKFDLDPRNMPKFVKQDWICPRNDWLYIYIYILYIYLMGYIYIYIHMHIICIIPLEVLLLILLPGCTTLPGTAERPFPSIEGSTRRQSQVEGAPRCCDEPWDFTGSRVACVQTKPMGKSKKRGRCWVMVTDPLVLYRGPGSDHEVLRWQPNALQVWGSLRREKISAWDLATDLGVFENLGATPLK